MSIEIQQDNVITVIFWRKLYNFKYFCSQIKYSITFLAQFHHNNAVYHLFWDF